jgi:hypothetical protein
MAGVVPSLPLIESEFCQQLRSQFWRMTQTRRW